MKSLFVVSALVLGSLAAQAQETPKVWSNFKTNTLSLNFYMSGYSYSAKRAADGQIVSLTLPSIAGDAGIPGAKNLAGKQAFYIQANGLTSPLTAFANHTISIAVGPLRVQNSACAGGLNVRVQDLGVSLLNRTTHAQLAVGSALVHAEADGTPLFQKLVDLSASKPWHPGYTEQCHTFGEDVYMGSALKLDRGEVTATAIFKRAECVSRHENDGSLFGKRYYYLEQPYTLSLTARSGETLLAVQGRTAYGVKDTRACQAIVRAAP